MSHANGLPLRALDDFEPFWGLEIEGQKSRQFQWVQGSKFETISMGLKVQYGDNSCGT
jgi:hypothetical protein